MSTACLALPTNRECSETISLLYQEALYGADVFSHRVFLLIIDTSEGNALVSNQEAVAQLKNTDKVEVIHLTREDQAKYFSCLFATCSGFDENTLSELMLPEGLSYGACTNRAFLFAQSLGCDSLHRRDSDCTYQKLDGKTVYPIHQELLALGKVAGSLNDPSIDNYLSTDQINQPVAMVAGSFIGEMSVDIHEIKEKDYNVYFNIVSLWSEQGASITQKSELVEESFKGAGNKQFNKDMAQLGTLDPMRVDMCNISFFGVHEVIPLPPAKDTIGSDYFLHHLVKHSTLPTLVHNRHIVNFYTPDRKTDSEFYKYHRRYAKFILSMPYLHRAYRVLEDYGSEKLLVDGNLINHQKVCEAIECALGIDDSYSHEVFESLIFNYKKLGGRFSSLANKLNDEKNKLYDQSKKDMQDFLYLAKLWPKLINNAKNNNLPV